MARLWAFLFAACCACGALWSAPSYSASSIVNLADQSAGPYAPNSILSVMGTGLALSAQAVTSADLSGGDLPTQFNGVEVMVNGSPAPLFYVSPTQINFLMPPNLRAGAVTVWEVLNSNAGPQVTLTLQNAAPALFSSSTDAGYAIAQQWPSFSMVSPESRAAPGGIVILYATGLGATEPFPALPAEIPTYAGSIDQMSSFQVLLNGAPLDAAQILYAGICPNFAGLYQVDVVLPSGVAPDPSIQLAVGAAVSGPGLRLAVQ